MSGAMGSPGSQKKGKAEYRQVKAANVPSIASLLSGHCQRCTELESDRDELKARVSDLTARVRFLEGQQRASAGVSDDGEDEPLNSLGPIGIVLGVMPDHGLELVVHQSGGMYELRGPSDKIAFLEGLQLDLFGIASERLPLTLKKEKFEGYPHQAKTFCFLYPLTGVERALRDPSLSRLLDTRDPFYNFCCMGGFAHFDADGQLLSVNGLAKGDGLRFEAPREFPTEVEAALQRRDSLQPITAAHLRQKRERPHHFAWVGPGDPVLPTPNGCFAYTCGGPEFGVPARRLYFPVAEVTVSVALLVEGEWQVATPPVSRGECRVCMEERGLIILLPCRHRALCRPCAERLESCPICRGPREGIEVCFDA